MSEAQREQITSYEEWLFAKLKSSEHRCAQSTAEWLSYTPTDALLVAIQALPGLHAPIALKLGVRARMYKLCLVCMLDVIMSVYRVSRR